MSSRGDVETVAAGATEKALVAAAMRGARLPDRAAALKELLRRGSGQVRPLLGKLATDEGAPAELRTTAVVALGRVATPENESALRSALAATWPSVVAAAAESLGRIGGRASLDALAKVDLGPRPGAARQVAFARTLLSYRLGLGSDRLAEPPAAALLEMDRERAEPLRLEPVGAEAFLAARPSLEHELPALAVAERDSVRFSCGGERLWLVRTEMVDRGDRVLEDTDRVAAIVLKESTCPDGWYVREYILAHPTRHGAAAVFGARPSGRLVHFGLLEPAGTAAALHLRALDAPGARALDFRAEVGPHGELTVREGFAGPPRGARANRPVVPTAAPKPGAGTAD